MHTSNNICKERASGKPDTRLIFDSFQRFVWYILDRVCHCDLSLFCGMFEMVMIANTSHFIPTIRCKQPNHFSGRVAFHSYCLLTTLIVTHNILCVNTFVTSYFSSFHAYYITFDQAFLMVCIAFDQQHSTFFLYNFINTIFCVI